MAVTTRHVVDMALAAADVVAASTALGVELRSATVSAHGSWDARGTLGLSREAPVGLTGVELVLDLETDADEGTVDRLLELTERYCVVARTLQDPPPLTIRRA